MVFSNAGNNHIHTVIDILRVSYAIHVKYTHRRPADPSTRINIVNMPPVMSLVQKCSFPYTYSIKRGRRGDSPIACEQR